AGSTPYQAALGNANTNQNYNIHSYSNKIFGRIDWNINDKHQLAIRHNYSGSESTNLERDARTFRFASMDYTQHNVLNSTVMELKSRFNNTFANSLILGYTNIHDYRNPVGQPFPQIQINGINGGTVFAGTDREATIFNTRQNTFEITNNLNIYKGKHTFTIGTHNEIYKIDYGFINSWNGRIDYADTTHFFNNQPSRVRQIYNYGDDSYSNNYNNPSASFNIALLSAYVQDDWKLTERFKLTPGLRVDYVDVPNNPGISTLASNTTYDYTNSTYSSPPISGKLNSKLFGQPYVSPRIGFNWDVKGDKAIVVRGGTGKFTGRIPFAWLGYAYYNNAINFGAVDYKNPGTFQLPSDPTLIHSSVPVSKQNTELDAFDPNFKM
ncbi:MAG TPA: TonB-dependent receptor, partial [Bacteroidia bacterium]|nr:TonB-dependent receptor [Bacteroidia bacterium]